MTKGFAPTRPTTKRPTSTPQPQPYHPRPMPIGRKQRNAIRPFWLIVFREEDDGDVEKAIVKRYECDFHHITQMGDLFAATTEGLDQVVLIDGHCPREELHVARDWGRWTKHRDGSSQWFPAIVMPTN